MWLISTTELNTRKEIMFKTKYELCNITTWDWYAYIYLYIRRIFFFSKLYRVRRRGLHFQLNKMDNLRIGSSNKGISLDLLDIGVVTDETRHSHISNGVQAIWNENKRIFLIDVQFYLSTPDRIRKRRPVGDELFPTFQSLSLQL